MAFKHAEDIGTGELRIVILKVFYIIASVPTMNELLFAKNWR